MTTDLVPPKPTQVRRPWRATVRTIFQATIALAAMWGLVVEALGLPDWAWVGASIAVAGGITRMMALPAVEVFLRNFLPFLSAVPKQDAHGERGDASVHLSLFVAAVCLIAIFLIGYGAAAYTALTTGG